MRKLLLALVALFGMSGVLLAADAVFLKYDGPKKELTVKEGDVEKTYKVNDKTKVFVLDNDGNAKDSELKVLEKAKEGKTKLEITADKDTLTEVKVKAKKKNP